MVGWVLEDRLVGDAGQFEGIWGIRERLGDGIWMVLQSDRILDEADGRRDSGMTDRGEENFERCKGGWSSLERGDGRVVRRGARGNQSSRGRGEEIRGEVEFKFCEWGEETKN